MLYEFKNHLKATEAVHCIGNTFGKDAIACFRFRQFAIGNETIEYEPRQGRPETCSIEESEILVQHVQKSVMH